jgi:DNA (cytosine-5)-methyltransferase 1
VFLENSPKLLSPFRERGLPAYFNTVLRDLAAIGYDARWTCLSASTLGAEHKRKRLWIVAHAGAKRWPLVLRGLSPYVNENPQEILRNGESNSLDALWRNLSQLEERLGEPSVLGIDDGCPARVDRLGAVGQGQVPAVAARAWQILTGE